MKRIPTPLVAATTLLAATLLTSCGQKPGSSLKEIVPADALIMLWVGDVPEYRSAYPESIWEGAQAFQKLSLEHSANTPGAEQLEEFQRIGAIVIDLIDQMDGEFIASLTPQADFDDTPSFQIAANYSGDLASFEKILAEVDDIEDATDSDVHGNFQFKALTLTKEDTFYYAVADQLLLIGNEIESLKASIDALNGTPLPSTIDDSPIYQKALSLSDGYDGAIFFGQMNESANNKIKEEIESGSAKSKAEYERSGASEFEGVFLSYPAGKEALGNGIAGILYNEKKGIFNLLAKVDAPIRLPEWASPEAYMTWTLQFDLDHFRDQLFTIIEESGEEYQQANAQAGMFIGATLDDLFEKALDDQITISFKMDEEIFTAALGGKPARNQNPLKSIILELSVKDRAILDTVIEKLVAQAGGMIQPESIDDNLYIATPLPIPGLTPGTVAAVGLTDSSLFLSLGEAEKIKAIVSGDQVEDGNGFESEAVERAMDGDEDNAFTAVRGNFALMNALFEEISNSYSETLSEEEKSSVQSYQEFMNNYLSQFAIVGTHQKGAMVFKITAGE